MDTQNNEKELGGSLIDQRNERIEKIKKLRELGINPYPSTCKKDYPNNDITTKYTQLENQDAYLSGRLMSWREHGQLVFADLFDQTGKIQLYIRQDTLTGDVKDETLDWDNLKLLDAGDFVEAFGTITKTQRGEISLLVKSIKIISKAIRPIPRKLEDKEERFRRRYLDILVNRSTKELFERKALFWKVNREFLTSKGFMEIETPVLEHVTGGADARPFVTHHNELDQDFYMRISTELFQKRLIGAGYEKIFTLGPNFRNEGISDEHLQEYYQIEWYWAYANYRDNMNLLKEMFKEIALKVYGKTEFTTRGHTFDLSKEWTEIDYPAVIKERFGIDIFNDSDEKLLETVKSAGIKLSGQINRNRLIDNLWKAIRKTISGPAFLVNEPVFMSPLAKMKPENPALTERFHIVIAGSELGNGYSEINDPIDQLNRFLDQQKLREAGDDEAQMLDIDFVEMLEYGMPPVSGYAHSERLFWFFEDVTAREGTIFPQMKHEIDNNTKEIYKDPF